MTQARGRLPRWLLAWLLMGLTLPVAAADPDPLEQKARLFREALVARHLSPEGLVLYRVRLDSLREDLASGRYPDLADTPTFTGLLAAGACQRAGFETGSERAEALEDARRALAGMRLLMGVTGVEGLLARGVRRISSPAPDERGKHWFPGADPHSAYRWRGDVSLDQYANGLIPAVAACRGLFPDEARGLIVPAARHLLAHDMRLVDPDGRVTRYGDLSPTSGLGLGLNSIAQLTAYGIFSLAAALDRDPVLAQTREDLRDRHRVVARARTTNVRVLGITNHSNDFMAWSLYRALVPLARVTRDPALPDLRHGLYRTWLRTRPDSNPYFAAAFCELEPEACDRQALRDGLDELSRFPLEKRKLTPAPELAALPRRLLPGRKLHILARQRVPIELRPPTSLEWKSSPYRIRAFVQPEVEYVGLDYLLAFWLYESLPESLRGERHPIK